MKGKSRLTNLNFFIGFLNGMIKDELVIDWVTGCNNYRGISYLLSLVELGTNPRP